MAIELSAKNPVNVVGQNVPLNKFAVSLVPCATEIWQAPHPVNAKPLNGQAYLDFARKLKQQDSNDSDPDFCRMRKRADRDLSPDF